MKRIPRGRPLGSGVIPACHDTNQPSAVDRNLRVAIRAIRGVDPRVAIITDTRPPALYINGRKRNSRDVLRLVRRYGRRG
jgi:hypothetical protein